MKNGFEHQVIFNYDETTIKEYLLANWDSLWKDIPQRKEWYAQESTDITLLYNLPDSLTQVFGKFYINEVLIRDMNLQSLFSKLTSETGKCLGRAMLIKLPAKKSIAQKAAIVAGLMDSLSGMFGNSGVGGPSPAIHPVQDDQSSSPLVGRGNEEREEDLRVKSKDKVVDKAPLPPKKHNFEVTGEGKASDPNDLGKMELGSLDDARKDLGEAAQLQDDTKNIIDQQNTIQGTGELAVGSAFG
jgi:hypothetical protein